MFADNQKKTWPGWENVGLIGRGSFGAVYKIQRDVFGDTEEAALKILSIPQHEGDIEEMFSEGFDEQSIFSTLQTQLKNIVAEYSMMRKMSACVNVVNCEDIQYIPHENGLGWDIFIKMELLTPMLKDRTDKTPEEIAIKLGKDICNALVACKAHGIIHRDIKPQNIFVSKYGDYKLGDFGIAKTIERTTGGTKIGTYKYMAPEVFNNRPYNATADIYSLGLVLYWLLNERRMPFLPLPPEKIDVEMERMMRERRFAGEALPPPAHGSEWLKRIILRACAYDPKDRYATAEEMLQDLKREEEKVAKKSAPSLDQEKLRSQEEERRKVKEEQLRQEEERRKVEEEQLRQEEERRKAEEERLRKEAEECERALEEQKRIRAEQRRQELERMELEEQERRRKEEERRKVEEERLRKEAEECERALEEQKRIRIEQRRQELERMELKEQERHRKEEERRKAEEEQLRQEEERRKAEEERLRKEAEERERALEEQKRIRAEQRRQELERMEREEQERRRRENLCKEEAELLSREETKKRGPEEITQEPFPAEQPQVNPTQTKKYKGWFFAVCAVVLVALTVVLTLFLIKGNQKSQVKRPPIADGAASSAQTQEPQEEPSIADSEASGVQTHEHQSENGRCVLCGKKSLKVALCFAEHTIWEDTYENKVSELCQEYGWTYQAFLADDSSVQIEQVNKVISENFDAMIIQATDRAALVPVVAQAANEGIVIIDHYNFMPETGIYGDVYKILMDEATIGKCQAEEYVTKYSDQGNIAIIAGPADSDVMAARLSGVREVMKNCPGINIAAIQYCDWDAQAAQRATEKLIAQNADLDAIFVQDDDMVYGVVRAVEEAGKQGEISIASQHFREPTIPLIQEGRILFTVGVPGASAIAEESMRRIADVADGLKFDRAFCLNMKVIDRGNIDQNLDFFDDIAVDPSSLWHGSLSTGGPNVVLLRKNGTVVAAGRNDAGQCNTASWTDIVAISSNCFHTVGLKSDGTVVAAGLNGNQQCEVSGWTDIVQIAAGSSHTVGLKADGTVVATGDNSSRQCETETWTDIVYIAASDSFTIGVKADGTIVETAAACARTGQWTDIVAVACDGTRVIGLKSDRTVVVSDNTMFNDCDYSSWTDIVAIASGYYHVVGLRSDGTVVAAGINAENAGFAWTYYGQCDVDDWTNIVEIAAGINTTVGLRANGTVVIIGEGAGELAGTQEWLSS